MTSFMFPTALNDTLEKDIHATKLGNTFILEVPVGTDVTELTAVFTLSEKATAKIGNVEQIPGSTRNDFSNEIIYTVTAENNQITKNFTVRVNVIQVIQDEIKLTGIWFAAKNNAELEKDVSATLNGTKFSFILPYEVDKTALTASFTTTGNPIVKVGFIIQQSGITINDFSSELTYSVTADTGTPSIDYTVSVTNEPNSEAEMTSFHFSPQDNPALSQTVEGKINGNIITVELPQGTDRTSLIPQFIVSGDAIVKSNGAIQTSGLTGKDYSTEVMYSITSQDGSTENTYTVKTTVRTSQGTEAKISSFNIQPKDNPDMNIQGRIDESAGTITVVVPADIELNNLNANYITSLGAEISNGEIEDFSSEVEYTVTSEDGRQQKVYTVQIRKEIQPYPPYNFNVIQTDGTGNTVKATWEAPLSNGTNNGQPASIVKYRLTWGNVLDNQPMKVQQKETSDGTVTGMTIDGITPGKQYVFYVVAFNDSPLSPESRQSIPVSKIFWQDKKPAAPQNVEIKQTSDGVKVTWELVDSGWQNGEAGTIDGYTIYYKQGSSVSKTDGISVETGVPYREFKPLEKYRKYTLFELEETDTDDSNFLEMNKEYTFAVMVRTSAGESELSESQSFTVLELNIPTSPPKDVKLKSHLARYYTHPDDFRKKVELTWAAPDYLGKIEGKVPHGIYRYKVYYDSSGALSENSPYVETASTSAIILLDYQTPPHKTYIFAVTAFNYVQLSTGNFYGSTFDRKLIGRESELSDTVSFVTYVETLPDTPTDVNVKQIDDEGTTVRVSWTVPEFAGYYYGVNDTISAYKIYYTPGRFITKSNSQFALLDDENNPFIEQRKSEWYSYEDPYQKGNTLDDIYYYQQDPKQVSGNPSIDITGLESGTEYTFAVSAINSSNESHLSTMQFFTPHKDKPPSAPTNLQVVIIDSDSVEINWNTVTETGKKAGIPGSNLKYIVYYNQGQSVDTADSSLPVTTVTSRQYDIMPNVPFYTFAVLAMTDIGTSVLSDPVTIAIRPDSPPSAPKSVRVIQENDSRSTVSVYWETPAYKGLVAGKVPAAITGYKVYYTESTRTLSKQTSTGRIVKDATSLIINNLTEGKEYTFAVTSFNSDDGASYRESDLSIQYKFTPKGNTRPGSPIMNVMSDGSTVTVKWIAPEDTGFITGEVADILSYKVYYTEGASITNSGETVTVDNDETSSLDIELINGKTYTFAITAANAVGEGPKSTPQMLTIPRNNYVYVEGGRFLMGSPEHEYGRDEDEGPQRLVQVSSFYMGKYEITYQEYIDFLNNTEAKPDPYNYNNATLNGTFVTLWYGEIIYSKEESKFKYNDIDPDYIRDLNSPVRTIPWSGAVLYANWKSEQDGLTPVYTVKSKTEMTADWDANGYRLPTEAEWEFAARGGIYSKGYLYSGSDIVEEVAWVPPNLYKTNEPEINLARTKQPNELGMYDMSGSAAEWCWDYYAKYPKTDINQPVVDIKGPATQPAPPSGFSSDVKKHGAFRVIRGYPSSYKETMRIASRSHYFALKSGNNIGFRLALNAD